MRWMLIPACLFAAMAFVVLAFAVMALATNSFADTGHTDQLPLSRPWPAPVGHHQPRAEDVDRGDTVSGSNRQLQEWDRAIDGRLNICRGC
jgi:hypothetical protein